MFNKEQLHKSDPILASVIDRVALPPIGSTGQPFHDLVSCIVEQQIHYRSSKKIFAKLLERADITYLTLDNFERFEEMAIPQVKISMSKVETLGRVVDFFENHPDLDWKSLSDADIRALWKPVKGVGTWTVDMLLLYTLERPNVFPADDYRLKKIMDQLYNWTTTPSLQTQRKATAALWSPHASVAVRYLLAYHEQLKTKQ